MNSTLRIILIFVCLLFLLTVLKMLRNKKLDLKHMLIWLFSGIAVLILALFPNILTFMAQLIGIIEPVNALFLFAMLFLILIQFSAATNIYKLTEQTKKLIQYIAILEKRIRDIENKDS